MKMVFDVNKSLLNTKSYFCDMKNGKITQERDRDRER